MEMETKTLMEMAVAMLMVVGQMRARTRMICRLRERGSVRNVFDCSFHLFVFDLILIWWVFSNGGCISQRWSPSLAYIYIPLVSCFVLFSAALIYIYPF